MDATAAEDLRLLVVVSGDFGELGAALFWLQGLRTSVPPRVLLPAVLARAAPTEGGADFRIYEGIDDIRRHLDDFKPDTVLLTTGYLLAINSGLRFFEVISLVRQLERAQTTLLTSDPFLGLPPWPALPDWRDWWRSGLLNTVAQQVYLVGLACRVWPMRHLMRKTWHVYPAPTQRLPSLAHRRHRAYCPAPPPLAEVAEPSTANQPPVWLFVLSRVDLALVQRLDGAAFVDDLLARLRETVQLGRRAVFIGPAGLAQAIQAHFRDEPRVSAFSTLTHTAYLQWLMAAEWAFFWNVLSFSLMHRVLAGQPVFFFDHGHFTHLFPAVAAAGERLFYGGWRPPVRRLGLAFSLPDMQADAHQTAQAFQAISDSLKRSPTPQEVLTSVRAGPPA